MSGVDARSKATTSGVSIEVSIFEPWWVTRQDVADTWTDDDDDDGGRMMLRFRTAGYTREELHCRVAMATVCVRGGKSAQGMAWTVLCHVVQRLVKRCKWRSATCDPF